MIKKIFALLFLLISLPVMAEDGLIIDNFLGNYYSTPTSILQKFSILKEKDKKIKIEIFDVPFHKKNEVIIPKENIFLCDTDKITNTKIYLDCEDILPKEDKISEELFRYVYVIIDTTEKGRFDDSNYLYFSYYNLGKKDYKKYGCDEKEEYDINCRTNFKEGYKREE